MNQDAPEILCGEEDINNNRVLALLSYISILFLVPTFVAKDSKFAQYHARQGMILFLISIPVFFVMMVICPLLYSVPGIGLILYPLIFFLPALALLGWMVCGIANCLRGVCKPLPLIGKFADLIKYDG